MLIEKKSPRKGTKTSEYHERNQICKIIEKKSPRKGTKTTQTTAEQMKNLDH